MKTYVLSLAAMILVVGLEGNSQAQTKTKLEKGSAVDAGASNSGKYYEMTNSFDPFGIAGIHAGYLGAGLSGYGPGATLNNQFQPWPGAKSPISVNPAPAARPATSKPVKSPAPKKPAARKPAVAKVPVRTMP